MMGSPLAPSGPAPTRPKRLTFAGLLFLAIAALECVRPGEKLIYAELVPLLCVMRAYGRGAGLGAALLGAPLLFAFDYRLLHPAFDVAAAEGALLCTTIFVTVLVVVDRYDGRLERACGSGARGRRPIVSEQRWPELERDWARPATAFQVGGPLCAAPSSGSASLLCWKFNSSDRLAAWQAHEALTATLVALGATDVAIRDAELVYAELLGNVVRHAPGPVEVALDTSGALPVLSIRDRGKGFALAPPAAPDLLAQGGRGLLIVRTLTASLSATRRRGGGCDVCAVLPLDALGMRSVGLGEKSRSQAS